VESCGHCVGISEYCGHELKWRVLTAETNKAINCSVPCPDNLNDYIIFAELLSGESDNTAPIMHSRKNYDTIQNVDQSTIPSADHSHTSPLIDAEDLIGLTFLLD
jgi:hypothetical protein